MSDTSPVRHLLPGDRAPNPTVYNLDGAVPINCTWADGPVVLFFLRHMG